MKIDWCHSPMGKQVWPWHSLVRYWVLQKKKTCRLIHNKENYGSLIPPSQCCHTTLPGKAFQKKNTAISVRMPAYIGHHWSRRGMCDVTKCRRMAFFWRTQYGKICSSSAPLQGTLGMFDDRVNPWNLLPELAFQWQISHKQAPLYTSIRSLPILHQIHRICDPRLKKASQLGST